ncbi:MAG: hypothetical protein Q9163_001915 [Psora crenata]
MASRSNGTRLSISKTDTAPGAYPSTPEPESPVIVSSQFSLSQAVYKRRAEYTVQKRIKVKVGTWNVAALSGTEKDIKGWFVDGQGISEHLSGLKLDSQREFPDESKGIESLEDQEERRSKKKPTVPRNDPGAIPGGEDIGLYVLGLQEIVDISSVTEALRPYKDPHPARKWNQAIAEALPSGYHRIAEQQLIGLFLVIYASPEILPTISHVSTTSVGTGLSGYMGNKGAVTARIVLGETTRMVFVNCHLTAGVEKGALERRNWDASQILSRTKFDPVNEDGKINDEHQETIGEEDFAFWFGDLNYRLEGLPGEDVRRLLMLHTQGEYGQDRASKPKIAEELNNPKSAGVESADQSLQQSVQDENIPVKEVASEHAENPATSPPTLVNPRSWDPLSDPTSLQATLAPLLSHDQLYAQMREQKAFHDGWREGDIRFLPTYKYDVGSVGMFDSSEKKRGPSWCDRILFRSRRHKLEYEEQAKDKAESAKKDDEMKLHGVVEAASDEALLFEYDPETDGTDNERPESPTNPIIVPTKAGAEDRLHLNYYTSHQRVLSSDHKPLDAVFTIDYDAVDPEVKARVHQEVARELDKAENEGRPVVTVVVDSNRNIGSRTDQASEYDGVDFGDVKYDHVKTRSVTIANTGHVPATVGFVDRSVETGQSSGISPPWLSIRFDRNRDNKNLNPDASQRYTLEPGDASNVELTLHITDSDLVRRLNENLETLEDVLVLRIQNGRDYFLPLRGRWQQSAFGRSIDKLVRLPEGGVRKLQHQRPEGSSPSIDAVKWSAPRELYRLTDAIERLIERAVGERGMIAEKAEAPWELRSGWPFSGRSGETDQIKKLNYSIRECLDLDIPLEDSWTMEASSIHRIEAVAETLVDFLNSLEDGIVTEPLWMKLENSMIEREKAKKTLSREEEQACILEILSTAPAHSVSFTFLTFMLISVANEVAPVEGSDFPSSPSSITSTSNEQGKEMYARAWRRRVDAAYSSIFADVMIRLPRDSVGKARKASESRRKHVIEIFLPFT